MSERQLSVRYALKGAKEIEAALAETGRKGQQAVESIGEGGRRAAVDLNLVDRAVRSTGQDMTTLTESTRAVDASMGTLGASAGISARALEQVRRAADPLHAAQARLARNSALVNQAFEAGQITAAEHALRLGQLQARYDALAARQGVAATAQTRLTAANDTAATSTARFGTVAQQVGFQVGDVATQIAMGGNAMTAMAVQGGQLLGVLGPMGALAGAAVTVIGALAAGLFKVGDASDDAATAQDRLNKTMETGKRIAQELEKAGVERTKSLQAETRWLVSKADAEIKAMEARLNPLLAARRALPSGLGGDATGAAIASLFGLGPDAEIERLQPAIKAARQELTLLRASLGEYADGRSRYFEEGDRLVKITDAGTVSLSNYREEQERELKLARMRRHEREIATAQMEAERKVREAMVGQPSEVIEAEVARARETAAAIVRSRQEVAEAERSAGQAAKDAQRDREKADRDWLALQRTVADELQKSNERKQDASDTIDRQIEGIRNETAQLGMSNVEREIAVELLKAEETARRGGTKVTEEQAAAIRKAAEARGVERQRAEEQKRAREDAAREAERTTDRVVDYAGDTFADFFADTPKSWKDMWDDMYSTAKQTLAKLAVDLMLRPVIAPVVNAVYGVQAAGAVPGLGGVAGTGGAAGGGFSLSSFSDVGRIFSLGGGSLSPGLDAWAAGALGWGQIAPTGGAAAAAGVAPVAGGLTNVGTSVAPGLLNGGSAFGGFASLSNVLGIAGAVLPGLIGGNYAQAAAGGIGAATGTVIAPGIGTAIGGMFGNLLGGLLGGGGKDKLQILSADNRQGNALLGDTFDDDLALRSPFGFVGLGNNRTSGHDAAFVSNMVRALQRSDQAVAQYLSGAEIETVSSALQSQAGYSRSDKEISEEEFGKVIRGRLRPILEALDINEQLISATLAGTDAEELQRAAQELLARRQAVRDIIDYSDEEGEVRKAERTAFAQLQSAIDELAVANADFGFSADKAAAAQRRLVEEYLGLGEAVEPMSAAEKALAAMNERIAQTAELAREVGITLTPTEIEQQLRDQLRTGFDEGIAGQIKAITDPLGFALNQWREAAAARLEEAKLLGADLVQVERLNAIERAKIVEQYAGAATGMIRGFLTDQFQGSGSVMAPRTVLANAEAEFGRLLTLARGGDAAALKDITGAAQNYLNAQRAISASGPEFFRVFDSVTESLKSFVGDTTGMQSQSVSMARVASNTENLGSILNNLSSESARGFERLVQENRALNRKVEELTETVRRQQDSLDRLTSRMRAA